jgi:hypothetical protein
LVEAEAFFFQLLLRIRAEAKVHKQARIDELWQLTSEARLDEPDIRGKK